MDHVLFTYMDGTVGMAKVPVVWGNYLKDYNIVISVISEMNEQNNKP